jgi:hypothetical protein
MEAISTAESAANIVQDDYSLLGVTLLYTTYARLSSHLPREEAKAIRDCDRAIRLLSLTPFNHAIAYTIRAQIELRHKTRGERRTALIYLDRADKVLQQLITTERESNRLDRIELFIKLRQQIDDISQKIVDVQPVVPTTPRGEPEPSEPEEFEPPTSTSMPENPSPTKTKSGSSTQEKEPVRLPVPTKLVWPVPDSSAGFQLLPLAADLAPDDMEATHLTIDEQLYRIDPVSPDVDKPSRFRLRLRQQYLLMKLLDSQHAHYAIVRSQDRPDRPRQFVVVDDAVHHAAWIDEAEFVAPYNHIHIIGGDQKISLAKPTRPYLIQPRIIGVVEALLTRVLSERERTYTGL